VRSKADTSQLNLSTAQKRQLESVRQKNKKVKPDMLRKKAVKVWGITQSVLKKKKQRL